MISGLLAQFPSQAALAVAAAVYLHGAAGDAARDEIGEQAMIATDLLHYLPEAMYRALELSRQPMVRLG
jgi:NAD(P)H-hydrate epimerase